MKIIVTGDIHIGKRSSGVDDNPDFLSTKYIWERIVEYAIENQVDLVALTGDVVDRDNRFFEAVSPLQAGLQKLGQHAIQVCIVAGNHDYDVLPEIVRQTDLRNVCLLGVQGEWTEYIFEKNGEQLQLVGWSFSSRYCEKDPVSELPAELVREDMPTIALVHGDAFLQKTNYAPVNPIQMKALKHVDAWLLGHIHKPQIVNEVPLILYPGSPQALSPKETGIHGPYWLEIENGKVKAGQLSLSPIRYEQLQINVSEVTDKEHFRERLLNTLKKNTEDLKCTDGLKYLVYDIELTGEHDHLKELKQWSQELIDYSGNQPFREKIRTIDFNVSLRVHVEDFLNDPSYMGVLANAILVLEKGETNPFIDRLRAQWKDKYTVMINSSTYNPLLLDAEGKTLDEKANEFILKECKRLFTELYNQRKDAD